MKPSALFLTAVWAFVSSFAPAFGQSTISLIDYNLPNADNEPAPVFPVPTDRQLKWQETEFYAFFHYGMNTYTNKEWGYGNELETQFAPTAAPNPLQWLKAVKAAGMRGGIAVVKHHDGFCLWPTATTTHNVTHSGTAFGRATNIPRDFAKAARKLNMKYGFYVSPWDRNSQYYGTDKYVNEVFLRQCFELAQYGDDQFEMWFDGANGGDGYYGGKNTKVSVDRSIYYDVPNLRDSIHKVCPNIILWGLGGEARWIGNEEGWAGETNWSPFNWGWSEESNGMYGDEDGWYWFPGESDAMFTDKGWFWHEGETPMTPERTFQMYLETVGRNSTLILNCPPDRTGSLPTATVKALEDFGTLLHKRLGKDLAPAADIWASDTREDGKSRTYRATNMTDNDPSTYWAAHDGQTSATITLTWRDVQTVRYVSLMEYIKLGQRVKKFKIEVSEDGSHFESVASGVTTSTIGYKRIVPLNGSTSNSYGEGYRCKKLRITIEDSKACPTLSSVAVF
ncbi:MAG: alpha-L-fucosidase [Prevotella sp.]|jgi:alpha-L-fucosidase